MVPRGYDEYGSASYISTPGTASVASIGNYLTGRNISAVTIAQSYYGTSNFNQALDMGKATAGIGLYYGSAYTYQGVRTYAPSEAVIERDLTTESGTFTTSYAGSSGFTYTSGGKRYTLISYGARYLD